MAQPGWTGAGGSADLAWNRVQLGSYVLPGVCTVTGLRTGQQIDVKKQKGTDGAVIEDNGIEPARFRIEVRLNEELWLAFQDVLQYIDPRRPGAARSPLPIIHPAPNFLNIREILITSITMGAPSARNGLLVTLACLQWFPQPKPQKKPTQFEQAKVDAALLVYAEKEQQRARLGYINSLYPEPPAITDETFEGNTF